jgi:hypothetical protein
LIKARRSNSFMKFLPGDGSRQPPAQTYNNIATKSTLRAA